VGASVRCGCPVDVKTAMQLYEEELKTDNIMDRFVESGQRTRPFQ
jgi:hypothetical protein